MIPLLHSMCGPFSQGNCEELDSLMNIPSLSSAVIVLLVLVELLAVVLISDQEPTVVGEVR